MMFLHILLKDLRRHRWEILLFVAIVAAWARQQAHPSTWIAQNARGSLPVLLFVLWFFLVVRIVQGESLVGDREFWPTRPYRTWPLILAKAIALILCLNVPLLVAQLYLLSWAHIPLSATVVGGLTFLQLEFVFYLTLPAAALAAITESIVHWVLAIVGLVLAGIVVAWLPWGSLTPSLGGTENLLTWTGLVLAGMLLIAILLWQYHRRRPWPARVLFAAAALVIPLCILFASTSLARMVVYAPGPAEPPLRLSVYSAPNREYTRTDSPFAQISTIQFPVLGSSVSPDTLVLIEGARFHFSGNDGWSAESKWANTSITLLPQEGTPGLQFSVPAQVADQIAAKHPNVQAELAVAVYRLANPVRVDTAATHFDVPGMGACTWAEGAIRFLYFRPIECRMPLRLPGVFIVQLDSAENTCARESHDPPLPARHHATGVTYGDSFGAADFDPDPIRAFMPQGGLGEWIPMIPLSSNPDHGQSAYLCQGTPFVLRTGHLESRMRVTIPLGPLGKENRIAEDGLSHVVIERAQ